MLTQFHTHKYIKIRHINMIKKTIFINTLNQAVVDIFVFNVSEMTYSKTSLAK